MLDLGGFTNARFTRTRQVVGARRTLRSYFEGNALGRQATLGGPGVFGGYCIRASQRHSLGNASAGTRVWFRNDLLATTARLASGGHLATDPLRLARLASALRADRLVTGRRGWQFRASGFWGLQTGPNPTDRAKLGSKRHLICDGRGPACLLRHNAISFNSEGAY
jgi:hypothetical protein